MTTRGIACPVAIATSLVIAGCGSSSSPPGRPGSTARDTKPTITGEVRIGRSTLRAGSELRAQLVLHNQSRRTTVLARGCPHGFVQLMLGSRTLSASPAWALPACSDAAFVARPGTTIYRVEVHATYLGCTMRGHLPQAGSVQCLPGNRMPPLPAGTYTVGIAASSIHLQHELAHVRSASVRIVN